MVELVISGGQTGAELGALRAARACGIRTAGWVAPGWMTEAGPAPWLAEWGLAECPEGETEAALDRARRRRCVKDCDAALIFGDLASPGSRGLIRDCRALGKRWVGIKAGLTTPRHITEFVRESRVSRLMITGNWESRDPGIAARVERFLVVVFRSLATTPRATM